MEESREEKLRRWLEEKKANLALQQQQQQHQQQKSTVKRGTRPVVLETPSTATTAARRQQQPQQNPPSTAQRFARFGGAETEQQTPVQGVRAKKPPQQAEPVQTPTGRAPDSSVSRESLDRRRALLQRTTLADRSSQKDRTASSRSSITAATPTSVTRASARKQLPMGEESLSARRREAVARTAGFVSVDMSDVSQLRESLSALEHVLLQWAFATARLERAAEKQQQQSEVFVLPSCLLCCNSKQPIQKELRAVWGAVNEQRSRALAADMEAARHRQARLVQVGKKKNHLCLFHFRCRSKYVLNVRS